MNTLQNIKKPHINITAKPLLAELLRSQAELAKPKSYPVKDFLLSHSRIVEIADEKPSRKKVRKLLTIFRLRDKTKEKISEEISKYYETAINGDYLTDGMPEIEWGIKGWIERKVWKLLALIGEPNHEEYKTDSAEYWVEA